MSSSAMPPPPSPLAHRRTRPNNPSLLATKPTSSCIPHKMSLPKASTFHYPSSPASEDDPVLSIPHLTQRAPTSSRVAFANWLYNGREEATDAIACFEETFSGARGPRSNIRRSAAAHFDEQLLNKFQTRAASPVDSGLGTSIGSPSVKNNINLERDSALGGSIAESVENDPAQDYITETNVSVTSTRNRANHNTTSQTFTFVRCQPQVKKHTTQLPLSDASRRTIYRRIYSPLLKDNRFKVFQPIVSATRRDKKLTCLRDIEQSLIHKPVTETASITPAQYRAFGELTVQLVVDTFNHLSETEQRRAADRPYDNGYFLDLVQQVSQLAAHINDASESKEADEDQPTVEDEITLEGGLSETGNIAELVRWRNGKGISLRTGQPYEAMPGIKRGSSTMHDEDVERSMARRKKGVPPEDLQLECSLPDCDKIFSRRCDLSKHEKTHTRPFKCPEPSCRYHNLGLPTEKELDRHRNDKHNDNPEMYQCDFCEFKTKRESNCKQHMEKKHNWTYKRVKGRDKCVDGTPSATPNTPMIDYSPAAVSNEDASRWEEGSSYAGSAQGSMTNYPYAVDHSAWNNGVHNNEQYPAALFPRADNFNFNTPMLNTNVNPFTGMVSPPSTTPASAARHNFTPQTPAYSTITSSHGPSPMMYNMDVDLLSGTGQVIQEQQFPTPDSSMFDVNQGFGDFNMDMNCGNTDYNTNQFFNTSNDPTLMSLPDQDFTLNSSAMPNFGYQDGPLFPENEFTATEAEFNADMFATLDNEAEQFEEYLNI